MKRILNIIIGISFFVESFAQTDKKIFVADSITKKPIEYACIVFIDIEGGTYSNENGFFYIPQSIKQIELSSIGYSTKKIELNKNTDTIFLSSKIYEISEVKVLPAKKKRKPVELGYAKEKSNHVQGSFSGIEFAVYIPLDDENNIFRLIKQVIIRGKTHNVQKIKFGKTTYNIDKTDYTSIFLINFYRITENKEIGERINTEDIVFTSKVLKSKTKLDVSKYNIYMPENGIFVAVEFVGTINPETGEIITIFKTGILSVVSVSYEIPNTIVYERRKFSRKYCNSWKQVIADKEFSNGYTPLFSVVLE